MHRPLSPLLLCLLSACSLTGPTPTPTPSLGPLTATYRATDLGTLGGTTSYAYAVSADGTTVVGESTDTNGYKRAFIYQNGTMRSLGTLPGDVSSVAWGVSADGRIIVGESSPADGTGRVVLVIVLAVGGGMLAFLITGLVLMVLAVPVAVLGLPRLLGTPASAADVDRLEALEEWTRRPVPSKVRNLSGDAGYDTDLIARTDNTTLVVLLPTTSVSRYTCSLTATPGGDRPRRGPGRARTLTRTAGGRRSTGGRAPCPD